MPSILSLDSCIKNVSMVLFRSNVDPFDDYSDTEVSDSSFKCF